MTRLPWVSHLVLLGGTAAILFPIYLCLVASTLTPAEIAAAPMPLLPGGQFWSNYGRALTQGTALTTGVPVWRFLVNSAVMALVIAIGKIAISLLSAYAIVFFRFPFRMICFWAIFLTLMLPVEVRIVPTIEVVTRLHLIDSYAGLTLPLIASATATLLFRQFFLTLPDELIEAARLDGAGPLRFLKDVALPLSATNIAALFVILFVYGWNQYLWPLLVTNTASMTTIVVGIQSMIGGGDTATPWGIVMATATLALLPPAAIIIGLQRWFVRGLIEAEK